MNKSNEKTLKKRYMTPTTEVLPIETENLLAGSGEGKDTKAYGN